MQNSGFRTSSWLMPVAIRIPEAIITAIPAKAVVWRAVTSQSGVIRRLRRYPHAAAAFRRKKAVKNSQIQCCCTRNPEYTRSRIQ